MRFGLHPFNTWAVRLAAVCAVLFTACRHEVMAPEGAPAAQPGEPVSFDLANVPYPTLSAYRFFAGDLADLQPNTGVLPFAPINTLFTDHAHKNRFVWMPEGAQAHYVSDHEPLAFDEGAVLIKNFWYDNTMPDGERRIIETRLMFRRNGVWEFANYVWTPDQTEAHLDMDGSYLPISWTDAEQGTMSTTYRIPSASECFTCHKVNTDPLPIGPKPRNLNADMAYPEGTMNQLARWVQAGYLAPGFPSGIEATPDWTEASLPVVDRVRGYLDMQCAHCHSDQRHCDYRPLRLAFQDTDDPENLGVCVLPDDPIDPSVTHIVAAGDTARSMMHLRLGSTDGAVRMPLLGRTLVHREGLALINEWIASLGPPCP
ncbi:MAG TPA: hypothetical protein PKE21_04320 [Flavobacteriales bacterium]|nr:hypothetical protein [Flavobacteriales bacterium]HMR26684.1 hypothetical protein [Flavobacteriales bacterium]